MSTLAVCLLLHHSFPAAATLVCVHGGGPGGAIPDALAAVRIRGLLSPSLLSISQTFLTLMLINSVCEGN